MASLAAATQLLKNTRHLKAQLRQHRESREKHALAKKRSFDWRMRRPRAMLAASLGSRRLMSSERVSPRVSCASSTVRSSPGRPCTYVPVTQYLCFRLVVCLTDDQTKW